MQQFPHSTGRNIISGVVPDFAVRADMLPARTETGIGALMPWAERLWFVTYVAHKAGTGGGTGLFSINDDFEIEKHPESRVGTYANRMVHKESNQLCIGPHLIDVDGNVRTVEALVDHRLTATASHLTDPENKVYYVTMEGLVLECDVHTLEVREVADLVAELGIPRKAYLHFKGGYTSQGRLVVAHNTYEESDWAGGTADGRLAEWDGQTWTILERCQFNEVTGTNGFSNPIFATGADRRSAILKVRVKDEWKRYRLPMATHTQLHMWTTEWPRIREVESERFLVNMSGMFYEMSAFVYGGHVWGLRPISTHLRIIGDYCSWKGMLVFAGDQTTPIHDSNPFVGQPQANLWFGKTDDLWQFGKPSGWGGVWCEEPVKKDAPSDPFLMTGFDNKVLHLSHEADADVTFTVEVDFLGWGVWKTYQKITVPAHGYVAHCFPAGFSAHWVRVTSDADCTATAHFIYT